MTQPNTIELDYPIKRDGGDITTVALRKPLAGELRGIAMFDLLRTDVDAVSKVLPRISTPALTSAEVTKLDPADLMQIASVIAGFFMTKAQKSELDTATQ